MDIETVRKLIEEHTAGHQRHCIDTEIADRYYRNKTDILFKKKEEDDIAEKALRNADNRIPSSFYSLLVNQKASYMFTAPPLFDVGQDNANKLVTKVLGDKYAKNCKDLSIDASNGGTAWVHYWESTDGTFKYGVLNSKQIIPIWSNDLEKLLLGVLRTYRQIDKDTGIYYIIYELWNDIECQTFRKEEAKGLEFVLPYDMFLISDALTNTTIPSSVYTHDFGCVPFIPFGNNNICTSDLDNIKSLIDTYDKVFSGFVNDLEDIQEIIFVLSGYDGTDLGPFLQDLKKYKTVKVDADSDKPGLSTLTIDIPVEAREKLLTITRKAIFEQGQGVDPDPQNFGNSSGVALKYLYSLLELKAGLMETEFKLGFGELVRAICKYNNIQCDSIIQTWTRTAVTNDTELAEIASKSKGVISNKTILKNHPWVEDADQEEKQLHKEQEEEEKKADQYKDAFGKEVIEDGNEE